MVNIMKKFEKDFYDWLKENKIIYTEFLEEQILALYDEYIIEKQYKKIYRGLDLVKKCGRNLYERFSKRIRLRQGNNRHNYG